MTIENLVQTSASGDNTIGHVATASMLGGAFASIAVWGFQLAHIMPPATVEAAFGVVGSVAASWILQKTAG